MAVTQFERRKLKAQKAKPPTTTQVIRTLRAELEISRREAKRLRSLLAKALSPTSILPESKDSKCAS